MTEASEPAPPTNPLRAAFGGIIGWCADLTRSTRAWIAVALAAVILLSVNLFASSAMRNAKFDLTEQRLFTISDGTRSVLQTLGEPVKVQLYFSRRLGEVAPTYGRYFERVRGLLEQYRDIARGKLQLQVLDPEPFSDAEDRAVAAGLRGLRLNQEGETGYFGLVGTNATDNDSTIPFFTTDREAFVEYDITKLIYTLANPKKRVVGLISGIPLDGGMNPMAMMGGPRQLPPQQMMEQIREFFDVKALGQDVKDLSDIDVLMLVQPDKLTPEAAYAIDQFALKGGKILAFVDPVAELGRPPPMMGPGGNALSPEMVKLLKAWGVGFDPTKVVGDLPNARRVQFGGGGRPVVTEYVAWLAYERGNLDQKDVLSGGVEHLNLSTAGFISKIDGAESTVSPILLSSPQAMQIEAVTFDAPPDPVGLLRSYKPGGKPLMLAARVSGPAKSAFADGAPKAEAAADDKAAPKSAPAPAPAAHLASGRVNAIVIADTDLLSDQFWVDTREFLGQQIALPTASNAALVVNALDNLSGSESMISLRGRGVDDRPFKLVDNLRRAAERSYREKEQTLTAKLKEVQDQLSKLEGGGDNSGALLSEADRQTIEKFRGDMLSIRRELRDVKRALREDIDRLDGWLKFANIALVPLLIGFGGLGWAAYQRRRTANGKDEPGKSGRNDPEKAA